MAYRREHYPPSDDQPWLDRPDAMEAVAAREASGEISAEQAAACRQWVEHGYLIVDGVLDRDTCEEINADVARVYGESQGLPYDELRLRFQDMWPKSPATQRAMVEPKLLEWLDLLLGVKARPFQTLNLPESSQQGAHSDEILMTTNPPGYMAAAWYALEDVQEDAGPLAFVPGSHRFPYVGAKEIGIPEGASEEEAGRIFDSAYYERMKQVVEQAGIPPVPFMGRQGDVLLWHSNLIHGAYHTRRAGATRNSLIIHYYGEGVETYSDLWQKENVVPGLR